MNDGTIVPPIMAIMRTTTIAGARAAAGVLPSVASASPKVLAMTA